ncbi:MAG TPA: hypothetical protein VF221_18320 [Chloroflexota bacterium]
MPPTFGRATHLTVEDRRAELVAVVERALPQLSVRAEDLALYLMVTAFWGLVLYLAMNAL